jgi:putative transcriptional regulator
MMGPPKNRNSGSPDPLDHFFDPLDQCLDPLDQANGKEANGLPSQDASPESAIDVLTQESSFESEGDFDPSTIDFTVDAPPVVDFATHEAPAFDVIALRRRMRLTQAQFAGMFGFPVATLRHWEKGDRQPTGTALVLLHVIRSHPRAVWRAVRSARLANPGCLGKWEPCRSHRAPPGFGDQP